MDNNVRDIDVNILIKSKTKFIRVGRFILGTEDDIFPRREDDIFPVRLSAAGCQWEGGKWLHK
jgi:hypothetical protein